MNKCDKITVAYSSFWINYLIFLIDLENGDIETGLLQKLQKIMRWFLNGY